MGIGGVSQPLTSFQQAELSVKNNPGARVGLFSKRNPGGFEGFLHFLTTRHPHLHRDLGTVSQKHRKSYVVRNCDVSSS